MSTRELPKTDPNEEIRPTTRAYRVVTSDGYEGLVFAGTYSEAVFKARAHFGIAEADIESVMILDGEAIQ